AKGIEARVVPELGYDLELMQVRGLKGAGALGVFKGVAKLPLAGIDAMRLVRRLAPSLVVSVGGYAAGPFTMAAAAMGVPTALMEQNTVPGVTNRLLGRVVRRAFLTYASSAPFFKGATTETLGNPLRLVLVDAARAFSYVPPVRGETVRVLVLGGSGGALSLNQGVPRALGALEELGEYLHVTHQVGAQHGGVVADAYAEAGFTGRVDVVDFIEDMASAYAAQHLLLCRAGATTIAEVLAFGLPAVYIPFPGAADDHQTKNAEDIVTAGGGVMVPDAEVDTGRLTAIVRGLVHNPQSLSSLATVARESGRPGAGEAIAKACLGLMS
ncbi:MAG: UDP-N-acetylglucosamine--N-acetylmuramyl-(pentapeptide) pyrophosphoryl-undecaprenol N-acetylglucosamine transferase, partial [Myxococcota bacterium]